MKSQKNDDLDAEAVTEARMRPTRRVSGAWSYGQTAWHKDEQTPDENIKANQELGRKSEPK